MVPNEADEDIDGDEDDDGDTEGSVSAKPSMSQRLIDELATMKAELLRVHVASDPRFALDLGTFVMVDAALPPYASALASHLRPHSAPSRVIGFESGSLAADTRTTLHVGLDRSWVQHNTRGPR